MFGYLALIASAALIYGFFLVAFKRERRWRGLKIACASFVAMIVVAGMWGTSNYEASVREEGWDDVADRLAASEAGFETPEDWVAEKERVARLKKVAEEAAARTNEMIARSKKDQAQKGEAENRRSGFHCLSAWDGSHPAFKRAVRDQMREPKSFEHIETRVTAVDKNGYHKIFMSYRARNGFGGMNVGTATGVYASSGCAFQVLAVE